MGLLDSILGSVMGGQQSSPVAGLLGSMLGGGQQHAPQGGGGILGGLLGGGQPQAAQSSMGGMGGLGGLLGMLHQSGLGQAAQSWVGNGPNQQVSPDQLQQAFGPERMQQMSQQTGLAPHDLLSQLSQYLPNVVNQMTPDGRMPDGHADPFAGGTTTAFDGPGIPAGTTFRT